MANPEHAGANGACPDYGRTLDPCPPGCASGTCVWAKPSSPGTMHEPKPYIGELDWDQHLHPFID